MILIKLKKAKQTKDQFSITKAEFKERHSASQV